MADELKPEQDKTNESVQIPLHFNLPVDKPSVYATNILLQAGEHEVFISFFEAQPPFITAPEGAMEVLKQIGVRADCVAKVAVNKERYKAFVRVMNKFVEDLEKEAQSGKHT